MAYEYLFSALPALPDAPGDSLKLKPSELCSMVLQESETVAEIACGLMTYFDLKAFERMSVGADAGLFAIYSESDFTERTSLPAWLKTALEEFEHQDSGYRFGKVWRAYYRNLCELAQTSNSGFLSDWLPWELGFRRALAEHRLASAETGSYVQETGEGEILARSEFKSKIESIVSHLDKGYDAWRAIDIEVAKTRIEKARKLAPPYSFNLDELISYIVQYMIYKEFDYI